MSETLPGTRAEKNSLNSPETSTPDADSCSHRAPEEHCCSPEASQTPSRLSVPARSPLDGCPVPIPWQAVLQEFQEQAPLQTLQHSTGTIEYRVWGNGPPIYFLNGMGGVSDHFALLAHLLRENFRCVIPEFPSVRHIGSNCFSLTLKDLSDRMISLAGHLGDKEFYLFATSFGSLVAWDLLARDPDRVIKTVIAGGFAHRSLSFFERFLIQLGGFLPGRVRSLPLGKFVRQATHRHWFPPTDPTRWNFFTDFEDEVPVRDLAWKGKLIRDSNLTNLLQQIETPVLLLQGEGDGLVSDKCREVLSRNLPHSETEMVANTGHLPHVTHPHRLGKTIRNFFLPELAK